MNKWVKIGDRNPYSVFYPFISSWKSRAFIWGAKWPHFSFGKQDFRWGMSTIFSHGVLETLLLVLYYPILHWIRSSLLFFCYLFSVRILHTEFCLLQKQPLSFCQFLATHPDNIFIECEPRSTGTTLQQPCSYCSVRSL